MGDKHMREREKIEEDREDERVDSETSRSEDR